MKIDDFLQILHGVFKYKIQYTCVCTATMQRKKCEKMSRKTDQRSKSSWLIEPSWGWLNGFLFQRLILSIRVLNKKRKIASWVISSHHRRDGVFALKNKRIKHAFFVYSSNFVKCCWTVAWTWYVHTICNLR